MPLVAVFAGVVAGGTAAWWSFPPTALAYSCNGYWSTDATRHFGFDWVDRGVRASSGDEVLGAGPVCERFNSVLVITQAGDYVETGWTNLATNVNDCHAIGDNKPHVFYEWNLSGAQTCHEVQSIAISGGQYYSVNTHSDIANNHPNQWIFAWDHTTLNESPNVGFQQGAGMTNVDRHFKDPSNGSNEDARGDFKGMQNGDNQNTWNAWGSEICAGVGYSNDPNYNNQLVQPDEVQVSTNPASC